MIQLPQRSVTRFFIPLIDVLTLLFCIFLLMPLIKTPAEGGDGTSGRMVGREGLETHPAEPGRTGTVSATPGADEAAELDRIRQLRQEAAHLQSDKIEALQQRLFIRVLEIDAATGKLYYQEGDQRIDIAQQADALALIARHREEAGNRELYYLFLFPRRLTGYPQEGQLRRYEGWFKGVAHGIDNPRAAR